FLDSPENNASLINRSPTVNWTFYDADNDQDHNPSFPNDDLLFDFILACYHESGGSCSDDNRAASNLEDNEYVIVPELRYLIDEGYYYNWTVMAKDNDGDGEWFDPWWRFNIESYVDIILLIDEVNFSNLDPEGSNDTTDDSPPPFVIENNGTVFVNISLNASALWSTEPGESSYYQFKIDNHTYLGSEHNSFDYGASATEWTDMPIGVFNGVNRTVDLNYSAATDTCEVDIRIAAPPGEPGGEQRSSIITFIAGRSR
ncbi:MAG: hypothetical protein ABIH92_00520, partial [Nanoarchaeota archaeon]